MSPQSVRRTADYSVGLLAGALIFVVLFWRLGAPTFWDPDEAHYAETTRELLASGDWWAPYYNEEPFFDKPILFHQLQGAAMAVLGATEYAARIVPALAALALIVVTVWFGSVTVAWPVGVMAGLVLAASPGTFALSRYAILDTLFTAFLFGGAALVMVAALHNRHRLQWPGYVLIALAVLTKGPVAFVLCGLTLLLAAIASSDARRRLLGLSWILGLLLILALSAPWFVYMYLRFGQPFVDGYLLDENLRLYAANRFGDQPGPLFYVRILIGGLLPWTGLLVGRLFDDVRAAIKKDRIDTVEILLWAWTVAIVGFFSFSRFRLDHYIYTAAPALCLLCARAWFDVRADRRGARHMGARLGLQLVGPLLVVIGVGTGYFVLARLELPRGVLVVPVAIALAGIALTVRVTMRSRAGGDLPEYPWIALTALLITYAGLIGFVLPTIEVRKVVPDMARWVTAHASDEELIATYRLNRWNPAFRFYVNRHVTFIDDPQEAGMFFRGGHPFHAVMRRAAYEELVEHGVPLKVVYEREGMWATSGRVLWRRQVAHERFVVVTRAR